MFLTLLEEFGSDCNDYLLSPGTKQSRQLPRRKLLLLGNFYKLAVDAFGQMVNLTRLDISDTGRYLMFLLVDVPFPRLVEVKVPCTAGLVEFLRAHGGNLKTVIVQTGIPGSGSGDYNGLAGSAAGSTTDLSSSLSKPSSWTLERIEMPELIRYIGPCDIIPCIVPGSQVRFLTVSWDSSFKRLEVERIMQSVKMSKKNVVVMDNLVVGWSMCLLGSIAENVPGIEKLRLRIVCPVMNKESMDVRSFLS
jgi:hypothetical protein